MLRWVVVLVVLLTWSPQRAAACSCDRPERLCEDLSRANTVVVGTVRSVAPKTVEVEVEEAFAGAPGKTLVINPGNSNISCDYDYYKVGEKMLIIGTTRNGVTRVSGCSHTGPAARAADDIAELRRMAKRGTATIAGFANAEGGPVQRDVVVRLAGTAYTTRTDSSGHYQFEVPAGRYTVAPAPNPLILPSPPHPIDAIAGACVTSYATARWNGRIRGTVRDRAGRPLAGVSISGMSVSWGSTPPPAWDGDQTWLTSVRTDARGAYELGPLRPDTYRVSVGVPFSPREPYPPSVAPDVVLGPGAIADRVDLVVGPPLATHRITARVSLTGPAAPRPVELISLDRATGHEFHRFGQPGSFTIVDVAGATIELRACIGDTGCTTRTVRLDRDLTLDLPIETHALTLRAAAPGPAWDWWRVSTLDGDRAELYGQARGADLRLIGIAGHTLDIHACVLDARTHQLELGCVDTRASFDRDQLVKLPIPIQP